MNKLTSHQAETLLTVVTEHERTSCADFDTNNKYAHYENGASRCARCVLLHLAKGGPVIDENHVGEVLEFTLMLRGV